MSVRVSKLVGHLTTNYHFVIIGAGASGLFAAYLLQTNYPTKSILILEKNDHFGGRSFSSTVTYKNVSIVINHGAMRFKSNHFYVNKLIKLFQLDVIPFKLEENKNSKSLIRGQNAKQLNILKCYNFNPYEKQIIIQNNGNMIASFCHIIFPLILKENNKQSLPSNDTEWIQFHNNWKYKNIPLYKWSIKEFLRNITVISKEFTNAFIDCIGATTITIWDQSVSDFLQQFGDNSNDNNVTEMTLKNGMISILTQLYKYLKSKQNVHILFKRKVLQIVAVSTTHYNVKTEQYQYNISKKNNIILCIPSSPLKQLALNSNILRYNTNCLKLINSVNSWFNCKINLIYNMEKLKKNKIALLLKLNGSVTDYECRKLIVDMNETKTLLCLTLFSYGENAEYWNRLQNIGIENKYKNNANIILDECSVKCESYITPSQIVVDESINQIEQLTNIKMDYPLCCYIVNWESNDCKFGSGMDYLKSGNKLNDIIDGITKPIKNENIYIAVSSYSKNFYWQEGAYQAVFVTLNKHFCIKFG